ncbi:MAG TPA: TetR/AcrR family transcriptional regulator [Ktedonobacteraceae bacterium]
MTETGEIPLRRMPQQARGQQRIHKLLNAAEQVFAEVGYDNATTNAIAAYADTSIGSLYQFFPNKEAILRAVILRYLGEMRELFDQNLTPQAVETLSLDEFLERLIRGVAHLRESHAGFRPVFFASQSSPELVEATASLQSEIVDRIEALLALHVPELSQQQRRVCSRTSVVIFQALMSLAMDLQGAERELQLGELRTVLLTYLQTYIPE